jgi:dipeptidyl aminopeptidase/acylaminoacyl peptidase
MRIVCFAAAILTASAQAQWPASGVIEHLGRLGPSDAREAARGVVSPDGMFFAYEVVHQHNRRIWLLNLMTGETRSLTPEPGVRYSLSWSPDSRRLAYMYNQNTLRVADVDSSREREIFRRDPPSKWAHPYIDGVTWDGDSALSFDLFDVMLPGERSVRWIAQLDGSNAHIDDRAVPRQRFASHRCCGGGSYGIWMGARCVAGPVEYGPALMWSPVQQTLVIATDGRLYAMRVPSGRAERIANAPANIHTVTMTRAGALALTTLAPGDSLGDLWLATPPFRTVAQDTIPRCPGPEARVTEFIRATRGKPMSVTEYPVENGRFALFAAAYPGFDVPQTYVGAVYHGRIGWLSDAKSRGFRVTAGDSALFSRRLDSLLGQEAGQSAHEWREWLLRQRATPPDAIVRLAQETAPNDGSPDLLERLDAISADSVLRAQGIAFP